jgi:branched-chain amino acid transport system substrate-binding protein
VKFSLRPVVALALTLVLSVSFASAYAAEPYGIYAILAVTGPLALLGSDEQTSLRLLETVVNKEGGIHGRPVHFIIQDDQSQPQIAVQLANAIVAKNVPVMIGPTYGASCLAVAPLVRNGPVTYCLGPSVHPAAGGYMFSASVATGDQTVAMLTFAKSMGWKRIAIAATSDSTGVDGENEVLQAIKYPQFAGMTVVDDERFAVADVSFSAQATRIKAAAPDMIIVTSVGTPSGTSLRALKDAGLEKTPVIANFGNLIHAQLQQYAAFLPDQMYLTAPRFVTHDVSRSGPVRDAQLSFYRTFAVQGIDPDVAHNLSWDPALVLIDALRHLGTSASAKDVLDYLEGLHGFAGTNGIFDFRDGSQRGIGISSVVVVRWNPERKNWSTVSEPGGKARVK